MKGSDDRIAATVMPIADVGGWQAFVDEVSTGARSEEPGWGGALGRRDLTP
jgi:hypothetical protein